MNREEAKAMIPVMQAFVDRKEMEGRNRIDSSGGWFPVNPKHSLFFGGDEWEYRIKPEKQEMWLNIYPDGASYSHPSKKLANEVGNTDDRTACIHIEYTEGQGLENDHD